MPTIVVPLDGSASAERALRAACAFGARLGDARVLVVSCPADGAGALTGYLQDRALLFSALIDVDVRVVEGVDPVAGILGILAAVPEGLLCMATHGRSGLAAAVLGSVAEGLVSRAVGPLVLVGPASRTVLLPGERGRLLVCSDGSAFADSIVPAAAGWSGRLGLEPWLAEVVGPDEEVFPPDVPVHNRQVEEAGVRLRRLASRWPGAQPPARTRVLHGAPESWSIVRFAEDLPASLIAMATHGRTGLVRAALGSVAGEVVRHSPCPVLIGRPTTAP